MFLVCAIFHVSNIAQAVEGGMLGLNSREILKYDFCCYNALICDTILLIKFNIFSVSFEIFRGLREKSSFLHDLEYSTGMVLPTKQSNNSSNINSASGKSNGTPPSDKKVMCISILVVPCSQYVFKSNLHSHNTKRQSIFKVSNNH